MGGPDGKESMGEKQGSQLLLMKESASIEQHQNSQFGGAGVHSTEMFSVKNTLYRGQDGMSQQDTTHGGGLLDEGSKDETSLFN